MTSVRILGAVEVWAGEERVELGGRRQTALLAYLALHANQPVSSEILNDVLWGSDRHGPKKRLQMAILRLRRALEPLSTGGGPQLQTVNGGYLLSLEAGDVDADVFDQLVRDGRSALDNGDAVRAGELFGRALALWRGAPLADVSFEDFTQAEIRRLEEIRLVALEGRIEAELQLGRHAQLTAELEALVQEHPTREHLAVQLMLALYRSGRQTEALEVYHRTRTHLSQELGLDPGPELRAVQSQILAQARDLGGHRLPWDLRATRVPEPPTTTIGRGREIEEVTGLLARPDVRLVTLTGPGGVGKTRLAQAVAHAMGPSFTDGTHWVELAGVARPDGVGFAMARALHITQAEGESVEDALQRCLARKLLFLVTDNFEHVLDASILVADLLSACPGLSVLATSREALRLRSEHHYVVAPLSVHPWPDRATQAEIETVDATALFVAAARRTDNRFAVTPPAAPIIARICSRLDGLPLALELAAAQTERLAVEHLEERLDRSFSDQGAAPRDAPARQRTLEATIQWSYSLLDDDQRSAFMRFAVFAGGATAEAALEITGARPETVEALIAKSLLTVAPQADAARLVMLESVRHYALQRLRAAPGHDAVQRAHCRYYADLVQEAASGFSGHGELDALDLIETEINNINAALEWALHSDSHLAVQLTGNLEYYWWVANDPQGLPLLDAAVDAAGDSAPPRDLALAHLGRSMELTRYGEPPDFRAAAAAAHRAFALYEEAGDHAGMGEACISLSRCARLRGDHDPPSGSTAPPSSHGPRWFAEEACRHARLARDDVLLGKALGRVAMAVSADERAPVLEEAGELLHRGGHRREIANVYCNAAYMTLTDGQPEEALALLQTALQAADTIDYGYLQMLIHGNLGLAHLFLRQFQQAREHFARELKLCAGIPAFRLLGGEALSGLAAISIAEGRLASAARLVGAARALGFPDPSDRAVKDRLESNYFASARATYGHTSWLCDEQDGASLVGDDAIAYGLDQARELESANLHDSSDELVRQS